MILFKLNSQFKIAVVIYLIILVIVLYKKPTLIGSNKRNNCALPVAVTMISIIAYYITLISGYFIAYE